MGNDLELSIGMKYKYPETISQETVVYLNIKNNSYGHNGDINLSLEDLKKLLPRFLKFISSEGKDA